MSEYIMGLGISVKICMVYESIIYLSFSNSDMTDEYFGYIEELRNLIDEETVVYDRLNFDEIDKYFEKFNNCDVREFDTVKSRYFSKLRERKELLDNGYSFEYPFSLNTAIVGKILLESLINIEKRLLAVSDEKNISSDDDETMYNLYSFHKTHKYTLIASNDFLERLAVDFDFDLLKIPNISFEKIKTNFRRSDKFNKYLNDVLLLLAKDIIDNLDNGNKQNNIDSVYAFLLAISQFEVIVSYLDASSLEKLNTYCISNNVETMDKGGYVRSLVNRQRRKGQQV